jgi:hypothetical protein
VWPNLRPATSTRRTFRRRRGAGRYAGRGPLLRATDTTVSRYFILIQRIADRWPMTIIPAAL